MMRHSSLPKVSLKVLRPGFFIKSDGPWGRKGRSSAWLSRINLHGVVIEMPTTTNLFPGHAALAREGASALIERENGKHAGMPDAFDALQELLGAMQDELALREWPEVWGERIQRAADFRRALFTAIAAYRDEWCER
jgi:hypothetical protein